MVSSGIGAPRRNAFPSILPSLSAAIIGATDNFPAPNSSELTRCRVGGSCSRLDGSHLVNRRPPVTFAQGCRRTLCCVDMVHDQFRRFRRQERDPGAIKPRSVAPEFTKPHEKGGVVELQTTWALDDALDVLADHENGRRILAGGTGMMMRRRRVVGRHQPDGRPARLRRLPATAGSRATRPGGEDPPGARRYTPGRGRRMTAMDLELTVNGTSARVLVEPDETLLAVLRERLHLTGQGRLQRRRVWGVHGTRRRPPDRLLHLRRRLGGRAHGRDDRGDERGRGGSRAPDRLRRGRRRAVRLLHPGFVTTLVAVLREPRADRGRTAHRLGGQHLSLYGLQPDPRRDRGDRRGQE